MVHAVRSEGSVVVSNSSETASTASGGPSEPGWMVTGTTRSRADETPREFSAVTIIRARGGMVSLGVPLAFMRLRLAPLATARTMADTALSRFSAAPREESGARSSTTHIGILPMAVSMA